MSGTQPREFASLLGEQGRQPLWGALGDQYDTGSAHCPVHDVLLCGDRDGRCHRPATAQGVQRRGGRAGLALDLLVCRPFGPPAEDDRHGEHPEQQPEDAEIDRVADHESRG